MARAGRGPLTWWTLAGVAVFAVAVALALDLLTTKGIGFDLGSYVLAARRFIAGSSMYPDPATYAPGPFDQYVYPPPVVLLFVPLAIIPFDIARVVWSGLLTVLAIVLLIRLVRPLPQGARWWAAASYVLFFPLLWDIQLGNVTLLTLFLCLLAWDARDRPWRSGVLAAAGVGLKLLPASLVVFFVFARRWRLLTSMALSTAVVIVLTWPIVGREWPTYLQIFQIRLAGAPAPAWNIVPDRLAGDLGRVAVLLIPLTAAVFGALCARRGHADRGFRIALAAAPLASTTVWYPYTLLALPLLLTPSAGGRWRLVSLAMRAVAWLLIVIQMWPEQDRYTTSPFVGLLLALGIGTADTLLILRSERRVRRLDAALRVTTAISRP